MGGTVSAGVDNNDLVDNLLAADYIKTLRVERVFRAVDRGMYFTAMCRESAYQDLAWKSGNIHLSAPCIYCEVMENLNLAPGMSFLNLGSGTGYLSTMAGLILGSFGINHGVEIHHDVVQYAQEKLEEFKKTAAAIEENDFCEPKFVQGNCLQLDSSSLKYDRVYCGAACPQSHEVYMKNLIKVGGILVLPLNDRLLKITRVSETVWETKPVLPVAFANLLEPSSSHVVILPNVEPISLMDACRTTIRTILKSALDQEHPMLKVRLPSKVRSKKQRILRRLLFPSFPEYEHMTIITGYDGIERDIEVEADDDTSHSHRGEESISDAASADTDDVSGSSSSASSEDNHDHRIHLRQHPISSSSDDSDDPSDSSSKSKLTNIYQVQRALFRAYNLDTPSVEASRSEQEPAPQEPLYQLNSPFNDASDSSVSLDDPSDNSMDVDQSDSETVSFKSKTKCTEGATSKRGRNKRKEAEMEESDHPSQECSREVRSSQASGTSSSSINNPMLCEAKLTHSNKKIGAKREKVDSGFGEDINSWEISPSDVGSELDLVSDSDSEHGDIVNDSDEILPVPHGVLRRNGIRTLKKNRKGDSSAEGCRQQETNLYVVYMRSKIQQLPLPPSLKSYVNYHREQ